PVAIFLYMCAPRAILVARVPASELQLTHGFLDQTLAYVGVLMGIYQLIRLIPEARLRRVLIRVLFVWLHVEFLVRSGEAALMYQFDIGYSSLFFYHLQWESVRLALAQYWTLILGAAAVVIAVDWVLRRLLAPVARPVWRTSAGLATAMI